MTSLKNIENEEEIKYLYEKIQYNFEANLVNALIRENLLPKDKTYFGINPNFRNMEMWKILTIIHKTYAHDGSFITKEDIELMKGSLYIAKRGTDLDPPFLFEFKAINSKVAFNSEIIKEIIKAEKQKESWQERSLFENDEPLTVYDQQQDLRLEHLKKESIPLFKGLGFSEDEANMMALGAIKHPSFTDNMPSEGLVGLALKIRGQNLTNSD